MSWGVRVAMDVRRRLEVFAPALAAVVVAALLACLAAPLPARAADLGEPALTEAQAAVVEDSEGNVLFSKNPDAEIPMASITKVMTAVVALESGRPLDQTYQLQGVQLMENAVVAGYQAGMSSTLRDLIKVMLVHSANDAASEVAIAVSGSEQAFVQRMNEKAAELGMSHTHFENPHGLDQEGHYASASDLVRLGRYALTTHPLIARYVEMEEVTVPVGAVSLTFPTTDEFVRTYRGALGIKTGVGDHFTSFLGAARRDGTTLYTCVLGCSTNAGRFTDTRALMGWAWNAYERHELATAGQPVSSAPFAYHFGLSCVVSAEHTTYGLVWPEGGPTTYRSIRRSSGLLGTPGAVTGVTQWVQDGRTVGTATYSASARLVPTYSGLGLLDRSAHYAAALARAA